VFQGSSQLSLDAKGRVSMPARHRETLAGCQGRLTLTRHPDGCVLVYPRPTWEVRLDSLSRLPYSARGLQRLLIGNAVDIDLDNAGRLLVPSQLRAAADLDGEVILYGVGSYLELWDPERLAQREQEQLADGLPPAAADFTF
jgi:MraZ protein